MTKDELYKKPLNQLTDFQFNAEVAEVFDDMLARSIPHYAQVQSMICSLAAEYYQPRTAIYDLGCSTGATMAALLKAVPQASRLVGLDNSAAMLQKAQARIGAGGKTQLEWLEEDLRNVHLHDASVVVMNYTLQFVRPMYRAQILRRIIDGMCPGGVLLLSEKVLESGPLLSRRFQDHYYDFKRRCGYSELEISQKREELENVLIPFRVDEQLELLRGAGFCEVAVFFKWFNFASFVAVKPG